MTENPPYRVWVDASRDASLSRGAPSESASCELPLRVRHAVKGFPFVVATLPSPEAVP